MAKLFFGAVVGTIFGGVMVYLAISGIIVPPFPDTGYCVIGVRNPRAAAVLSEMLRASGGPGVKMAFDEGPTHHVLLDDARTIILWKDDTIKNLSQNVRYIAVSDPKASSRAAA